MRNVTKLIKNIKKDNKFLTYESKDIYFSRCYEIIDGKEVEKFCSELLEILETPRTKDKFSFMLLGRLKSDCDYWLGMGNKSDRSLWAGNPFDQIEKMRELWKITKPHWLSLKEIENYAEKMGVKKYKVVY